MNALDLPQARAVLAPPERWVVVGGTSVGKSTLVAHWTGATIPTGLGGITDQPVGYELDDRIVIDTPSLDHQPDLFAVASGCDVLVWVIDGLRPVGNVERSAVRALSRVAGSALGLISRADLIPCVERDAIVARCASACPGPVQLVDLRHGPPEMPTIDRAHTRRHAVDAALWARKHELAHADAVLDGWRDLCRDTPVAEAASALEHYREHIARLAREHAWPTPPQLPTPPQTDAPAWRQLLGGSSARDRERTATAAVWFRDGHVVLTDWLRVLGDDNTVRRERNALSSWSPLTQAYQDASLP